MPAGFKNGAWDTDARHMSETTLNDQPATPSFMLDGEAPRLASAPLQMPSPTMAPAPAPDAAQLAAPQLAAPPPGAPAMAPALPSPMLPSTSAPQAAVTLPTPAPPVPTSSDTAGDADAQPAHPMAHLMPAKSKATEASRRAAEARAAKKAKAKKIKIATVAVFLVVAAVVGPPLFRWLSDAINQAGDTSTEQPAE